MSFYKLCLTKEEIYYINKCRLIEERGYKLNNHKYKLLNNIIYTKVQLVLEKNKDENLNYIEENKRDDEYYFRNSLNKEISTDASSTEEIINNINISDEQLYNQDRHKVNITEDRAERNSQKVVTVREDRRKTKEEKERRKRSKSELKKTNLEATLIRAGVANKIWNAKINGKYKIIKSKWTIKNIMILLGLRLLPKIVNKLISYVPWKYKILLYGMKPFLATASYVAKLLQNTFWYYLLAKVVLSVIYRFTWMKKIKSNIKSVLGKDMSDIADIRNGYIKDDDITALSIIANNINNKWYMKLLNWFSYVHYDINDVELLARSEMNKKINVNAKMRIMEKEVNKIAAEQIKEKRSCWQALTCQKTKQEHVLTKQGKKVANKMLLDVQQPEVKKKWSIMNLFKCKNNSKTDRFKKSLIEYEKEHREEINANNKKLFAKLSTNCTNKVDPERELLDMEYDIQCDRHERELMEELDCKDI